MDPTLRKVLVIDASVAQSAGTREHPVSKACREFLEGVFDICHSIVMSPDLIVEWEKHATLFTQRWLRAMREATKVDLKEVPPDSGLRAAILALAQDEGHAKAMLKDAHLVEGAIKADLVVVSLDERARRHFKTAARLVPSLRQVVWVNPVERDENALEWIKNGAVPEASRCLGFGLAE